MADVLLTHSYHLYYDRKQMRKMQPYPPLGTLYAAALLRSAGLSVTVFDTMLNDPGAGFQAALEQHRQIGRCSRILRSARSMLPRSCAARASPSRCSTPCSTIRERDFRLLSSSIDRELLWSMKIISTFSPRCA